MSDGFAMSHTDIVSFGMHRAWVEGDIVRVVLQGLLTVTEIKTLLELIKRWKEERGINYVLYDVKRLLPPEPEVRRWMTKEFKIIALRGALVVGASPVLRLVSAALQQAISLVGRQADSPLMMLKNEEEALAWIAKDRQQQMSTVN